MEIDGCGAVFWSYGVLIFNTNLQFLYESLTTNPNKIQHPATHHPKQHQNKLKSQKQTLKKRQQNSIHNRLSNIMTSPMKEKRAKEAKIKKN